MSDLLNIFNVLRRPRILIRAARIGARDYRRDRDIKRLLHVSRVPAPGEGMTHLLAIEQDLETIRLDGDATYSISKHVEILAALVVEAQVLTQRSNHQPIKLHPKSSPIPRRTRQVQRPFADA